MKGEKTTFVFTVFLWLGFRETGGNEGWQWKRAISNDRLSFRPMEELPQLVRMMHDILITTISTVTQLMSCFAWFISFSNVTTAFSNNYTASLTNWCPSELTSGDKLIFFWIGQVMNPEFTDWANKVLPLWSTVIIPTLQKLRSTHARIQGHINITRHAVSSWQIKRGKLANFERVVDHSWYFISWIPTMHIQPDSWRVNYLNILHISTPINIPLFIYGRQIINNITQHLSDHL